MAHQVKNPPAMQETQETKFRSLGQEDPLEKEWQPTAVFLPGQAHGQRSLAGCSPRGRTEWTRRRLNTHTKILTLILDLYIFLFYNMCLWGLKYYLQTLLHIF